MKKCYECQVEMIEKYGIRPGKHGTGYTENFMYIVTDEKEHYGRKASQQWVKCRICPNCGKIEMYIDPSNLK